METNNFNHSSMLNSNGKHEKIGKNRYSMNAEKLKNTIKKGKTRDLFKKIRDLWGQFVAKSGTLLNRNEKQLSNAK